MGEVAKIEPRAQVPAVGEAAHFELMQRKAALFATSPLIPESLRSGGQQQALANCYIGLQMAEAMQENALTVLQNIHVVKGKAGFSAQFMIARANASGIFKDGIDWRIEGKGETLSVTAFGTLAATGREVSFTADMAMAKAEGWTSNPKYRSMPDLMLRYRSGTFLVRLYAPQVMFGYQTVEEVEDVVYAASPTPAPEGAIEGRALLAASLADDDDITPAAVEEAAGVEPEGEAGEAAASASGGLFSEPEHIALGSEIEAKLKLATSGDALASSWLTLTDDLKRLKAMDVPTYDAIVRLKNRMKAELTGGAE
jgi:hypothetical protein